MSNPNQRDHWEKVYIEKREDEVSWFQETPSISLELIHAVGATPDTGVVDIGGGASRLVDALVGEGFRDITVLDLAQTSLQAAKARLGERASAVSWVVADVTQWEPDRRFDIWHDRAAFHFLTEAAYRAAYVDRLLRAVRPGGHAIIATFAIDGPERCSGLPVVRYDAARLGVVLGNSFKLAETRRHDHRTPMGNIQRFQFNVFRRA